MTLIEVLAALTILSTVLGGILVARARMMKLDVAATERLNASREADQLLTQWWVRDHRIPVDVSGRCGDRGQFTWRTSRRSKMENFSDLEIVRLTLSLTTAHTDKDDVIVELPQSIDKPALDVESKAEQ